MTEGDLNQLVESSVPEGRTVEYKATLPGTADADRKEFLADVSSFANTSGGILYLGIREEEKVAVEIVGLTINVDEETQRIENMLRDGMEPRLPAITIDSVKLASSKAVLVLRIPRSWALPHRVTFKGHDKFYARNTAGKYSLDVTELRRLFSQSEALAERMRRFRLDRLAGIQAGESPLGLGAWAKLVVHLIPLESFDPATVFDATRLEEARGLRPIAAKGWSHRHNIDGFAAFARDITTKNVFSYLQVFRNGVLEAGDIHLLGDMDGEKYIPSPYFEKSVADGVGSYLQFQADLGIQPPVYIGLSLLNVRGFRMGVRAALRDENTATIDRDEVILPEVAIQDLLADPFLILRPVFDMVWNATGWQASLNYSDEGSWNGR